MKICDGTHVFVIRLLKRILSETNTATFKFHDSCGLGSFISSQLQCIAGFKTQSLGFHDPRRWRNCKGSVANYLG
jgi:hypothetical protein